MSAKNRIRQSSSGPSDPIRLKQGTNINSLKMSTGISDPVRGTYEGAADPARDYEPAGGTPPPPVVGVAPHVSGAFTNDNLSISLTFDEAYYFNPSCPALSAWTMKINGTPVSVTGMSYATDNIVGLNPDVVSLEPSDVILVSYTNPGCIKDKATKTVDLPDFVDMAVTNSLILPNVNGATVLDSTTIQVAWSGDVGCFGGASDGWQVGVNGGYYGIDDANCSFPTGQTLWLKLVLPLVYGDVITVEYEATTGSIVDALSGMPMDDLSPYSVTNTLPPPPATYPTGGTETDDGTYHYNKFLIAGDLVVTGAIVVDVLVVAGGGGGAGYARPEGAGGAGGLVHAIDHALTAGTYPIVIGAGGSGNAWGPGGNGSNSTFDDMTAIGGGGGGMEGIGADGGSAGGGGRWGPGGNATQGDSGVNGIGYGNHGGNPPAGDNGGGGGGAGFVGADNGNGGDGLQFDIDGTLKYYAGGGGSQNGGHGGQGGGGVPGGGGGGYGEGGGGASNGGSGGTGVVIIRWLIV